MDTRSPSNLLSRDRHGHQLAFVRIFATVQLDRYALGGASSSSDGSRARSSHSDSGGNTSAQVVSRSFSQRCAT